MGGIGVKRPVAEEGKVSQVPAYSQHCTPRRPSPLRVNLMRHNGGEHEIPRFSLIRPQWRFPDKPGRSLFFFCPLHIRTAVFFTTIEPQCHRVLDFPRGLGSAGPEQPKIAPRCRAACGGKSDGEGDPFPIFNASIVTLAPSGKSSCVANWPGAGGRRADETKLGQKPPPRREGRSEIVHFNRRCRFSCPYSFYRS